MGQPLNDYPILKVGEDRFQRRGFSEGIAQTIYDYKNEQSLVIGLYGAWGTGKSSVLNMIESQIRELDRDENVIIIKFNPWRFSDEKSLLVSFFNSFAKAIDTKIEDRSNKIAKSINKYADALSLIPTLGSALATTTKTVSKSFIKDDIEDLKSNLDKAIKATGKRILIVIDDIDRLDKNEIYSILRIVKLNADFPNTIYLLSFDENMVAEAIGERFGDTGIEAGRNFLEKIVQVPLPLPKLLQSDLISYSYDEIDKILYSLDLDIPEDDLAFFSRSFKNYIALRISSPRLVIRYINSIQFALPLLKGEVNIADLLLIEAVKVFYPNHYQFIKENSHYFLRQYSTRTAGRVYMNTPENEEWLKSKLDSLTLDLTREEKEAIEYLLASLYPNIAETVNKSKTVYRPLKIDRLKNKCIGTHQYHDRYFLYTVLKGEISDAEFEDYIQQISLMNEEECSSKLCDFIERSSDSFIADKLDCYDDNRIDQATANKLGLAICLLKNDLSSEIFWWRGSSSLRTRYARFVASIGLRNEDKLVYFAEILPKIDSIFFVQEIYRELFINPDNENKITEAEKSTLSKILIDRVKAEYESTPMFEIDGLYTSFIFKLWKDLDQKEFNDYIRKQLEDKPERIQTLLRYNANRRIYWGSKKEIVHPMTKENFDDMTKIYDLDYLYGFIKEHYAEELDKEPILSDDEVITDNLLFISQFLYYYNKYKQELLETQNTPT